MRTCDHCDKCARDHNAGFADLCDDGSWCILTRPNVMSTDLDGLHQLDGNTLGHVDPCDGHDDGSCRDPQSMAKRNHLDRFDEGLFTLNSFSGSKRDILDRLNGGQIMGSKWNSLDRLKGGQITGTKRDSLDRLNGDLVGSKRNGLDKLNEVPVVRSKWDSLSQLDKGRILETKRDSLDRLNGGYITGAKRGTLDRLNGNVLGHTTDACGENGLCITLDRLGPGGPMAQLHSGYPRTLDEFVNSFHRNSLSDF